MPVHLQVQCKWIFIKLTIKKTEWDQMIQSQALTLQKIFPNLIFPQSCFKKILAFAWSVFFKGKQIDFESVNIVSLKSLWRFVLMIRYDILGHYYVKVCSVSSFFLTSQCATRFLYIIHYFWNNTFYWMVQGMGIVFFICGSFHSISTWRFLS